MVRGRRLAFAKAYTYAEAGYPVAGLDLAMRLGSVSKLLTTVALLAELSRRGLREGVDAGAADLLGVGEGAGPPLLARVTLRHLLTHDAGLCTSLDVRPDRPADPLCEHRITQLLDGAKGPARPGQLGEALAALRDDEAFARLPGGGRPDYSNEGFILLGEILARLACGRADAYEHAIERTLLTPAGVDAGDRGCLLGAGRRRARARCEAPAHPASPTWARKRFADDDLDESPLVLAPYADNGPFLGGAAGWCVPLLWLARVLAALGPHRDGSGLWQARDVELALTPSGGGGDHGHGVYVGKPAWWKVHRLGRGAPSMVRVIRFHHNGRLEGGEALLLHQMAWPPPTGVDAEAALDASLSIAVAFNHLGALYEDPHGRQLLSILRELEGAPGWGSRDLFSS
jgi:CubicO group peptidase (beta-lactamase class C family)